VVGESRLPQIFLLAGGAVIAKAAIGRVNDGASDEFFELMVSNCCGGRSSKRCRD
jgi:hypothetical protein